MLSDAGGVYGLATSFGDYRRCGFGIVEMWCGADNLRQHGHGVVDEGMMQLICCRFLDGLGTGIFFRS